MAFSIGSFAKLRSYGGKTVYVYNTTDAMSVVMGTGYFNNCAPEALSLGDMILCSIDTDGTPDLYHLLVTGVTAGVVTVSAADRLVVPIDLQEWREVSSNTLQNLAAHGGILATDSTPKLNTTNSDTDGTFILHWAASDSNAIIAQKTLPGLNTTMDLELHVVAKMVAAGTLSDTPTLAIDTYFIGAGVTSAKKEDTSAAIAAETYTEYTITIQASDIATGATGCTIELTPGAHTTDALYIAQTWLEGYRFRLM